MGRRPLRVAWFVSPHGFGHAARAAAVAEALHEREPGLELTFFSSVPRWFLDESLGFRFGYREVECDIGFVQRSAIEEDLGATLGRLEQFWRAEEDQRAGRVEAIRKLGVAAVVCDIAPGGLATARAAGVPSVLIENFVWSWIYRQQIDREPRFRPWVTRMRELEALADLRIQPEPVCAPEPEGVGVGPIARRPRSTPEAVRARLGVAPERSLVLVSMGGIETRFAAAERWGRTEGLEAVDFVVPGGAQEGIERRGSLVLLPHHTPIFHPDLVHAADAVVGKLGYSTVAEAVAAGTRFAYLPRPGFRESAVLADYVRSRIPSLELLPDALESVEGLAGLADLLVRPRPSPRPATGAAEAAAAILRHLEG